MRTALVFQEGNFVGGEYYAALVEADLRPHLVLAVGRMSSKSRAVEHERTGGKWNPPPVPAASISRFFSNIGDSDLPLLLRHQKIDVAIQAGIGILKGDLLAAPRIGWLNVHPGRLPSYRGNSCPEWAILNREPVVATAHFIDANVDTGPIIFEMTYEIAPDWSYYDFRANLYRHCAMVLVGALRRLMSAEANGASIARPQGDESARYWPPLGDAEKHAVRARFPLARTGQLGLDQ